MLSISIPRYLGEPNREQAIVARLKEANEILQMAQNAVGKIPSELPIELIEGSPAEAIINMAKTRGSSVIVIGSCGSSSMAELILGSTSHKVVTIRRALY